MEWMSKTAQKILHEPTGGTSAEELVKRHKELRDEINAKDYEFEYVHELGQRLLAKNPRLPGVNETLSEIVASKKALDDAWRQKDLEYRRLLELQVFNREADRIDALTKGHEKFLGIATLGVRFVPNRI